MQKPTSAEGSQAAARQDKLSSIPPTDAGPALPGGAQSEPPRPGPAAMPQAPRRPSRDTPRCRRRPLPPRLPAAPAKTRSGGWVGGGGWWERERTRRQGGAKAPTSATPPHRHALGAATLHKHRDTRNRTDRGCRHWQPASPPPPRWHRTYGPF